MLCRSRKRILNEIKGRMMKDTVLLEAKPADPYKRVFKLQLAVGGFDMAAFDFDTYCEFFKITIDFYSHICYTDTMRADFPNSSIVQQEKL